MFKKNKKPMIVTEKEHEKWHKENGSCGSGKEHELCMKEARITIKKTKKKI